jgi:hypothetical protein
MLKTVGRVLLFLPKSLFHKVFCNRVILYCILLCVAAVQSIARENKDWAGYGIQGSFMAGKIFKHTVNFTGPVPDLTSSFDLTFLQRTTGTKEWQQRRHYPMVGFGITYTNYGMDSVYGQCIGVYPALQLPIIKGEKLEWTCKLGLGMGYVSRHYERKSLQDTINNAIGANFNNFTTFATDLRYKIDHQWAVSLGFTLSHISDGSWRLPNLGINTYGGHIALRYFPVTDNPIRIKKDLQPLKNRWLFHLRLGFSGTEYGAPDGPVYPVYVTSLFVSKRYASRNKAFAGIDGSFHENFVAFQRNNEINPGKEWENSWKNAVFVGNEFLVGRFGLVLQVGVYLRQAVLKHNTNYQKVGYNFYLLQKEKGAIKELNIYTMLKTHRVQAEFIEFGLGAGF